MEKQIEDWKLAEMVREKEDENALAELCERHSGIFINMVYRFGGPMTQTQKNDLIEERSYHIYMAAKKYDRDRKSKFSTFLASQAMYQCLSQNTKNTENKDINFDEVSFQEADSNPNPLEESANREVLLFVLDEIDNLNNERGRDILKERYFSTTNFKLKPWRQIASKFGLSVQGCIDIHDRIIREIGSKINKNNGNKLRRTHKRA